MSYEGEARERLIERLKQVYDDRAPMEGGAVKTTAQRKAQLALRKERRCPKGYQKKCVSRATGQVKPFPRRKRTVAGRKKVRKARKKVAKKVARKRVTKKVVRKKIGRPRKTEAEKKAVKNRRRRILYRIKKYGMTEEEATQAVDAGSRLKKRTAPKRKPKKKTNKEELKELREVIKGLREMVDAGATNNGLFDLMSETAQLDGLDVSDIENRLDDYLEEGNDYITSLAAAYLDTRRFITGGQVVSGNFGYTPRNLAIRQDEWGGELIDSRWGGELVDTFASMGGELIDAFGSLEPIV